MLVDAVSFVVGAVILVGAIAFILMLFVVGFWTLLIAQMIAVVRCISSNKDCSATFEAKPDDVMGDEAGITRNRE